jgi:hypothetical protein
MLIGRPVSLAAREFEQVIMVPYRTEYMVDGTLTVAIPDD